jgi:transcriptional regulator with XRE-family HTH domain
MDEKIGRSLRIMRQRKGLTLEQLSTRCSLSIGFLSQVERGLSSLSITSLHAICDALEVPLTHFFAAVPPDGPLVVRAHKPRSQISIGDSQVVYNLLSNPSPDRLLEAVIAQYPPHYQPLPMTHAGEEFGYVLEGEVLLVVEEKEEMLKPGDSFHIFSTASHTVQNLGDTEARILWILTMKLLEGGENLQWQED